MYLEREVERLLLRFDAGEGTLFTAAVPVLEQESARQELARQELARQELEVTVAVFYPHSTDRTRVRVDGLVRK